MRKRTLSGTGFERHRKLTRRECFPQEIDRIGPSQGLVDVVAPYSPTGQRVRPPVRLERMLRRYRLQNWYNLSDPAVEDVLYDIEAMRRFIRVDQGREPLPDETTICTFCHVLDCHGLGAALFAEINAYVADPLVQVSGGTIVDATIICARNSTKTARGARDPKMQQVAKRKQSYFGMKGHFGVESVIKLIHAVALMPPNTADGSVVGHLLHGSVTPFWGAKPYHRQRETIAVAAPTAQKNTHEKDHQNRLLTAQQKAADSYKSSIRKKAAHPIGTIERVFSFRNLRYRRIAKSANRLFVANGLANLYTLRRRLMLARV